MSTISPQDSIRFSNLVAENGGVYIDSTVSEKLGLTKEQIIDFISVSAFNNPFFQMKKDMYQNEEFSSQFMLEL